MQAKQSALVAVQHKYWGFRYADPRGDAPYLGRDWVYGIHDCYSLMRDFYRRELEIVLDDFPEEKKANGRTALG